MYICHFYLHLAVIWTSIDRIVTIPTKLCLVKMGNGKGVKLKIAISELFILLVEFANLTNRPHMKLGRDIEFGDVQGMGILKFL